MPTAKPTTAYPEPADTGFRFEVELHDVRLIHHNDNSVVLSIAAKEPPMSLLGEISATFGDTPFATHLIEEAYRMSKWQALCSRTK